MPLFIKSGFDCSKPLGAQSAPRHDSPRWAPIESPSCDEVHQSRDKREKAINSAPLWDLWRHATHCFFACQRLPVWRLSALVRGVGR